MANKYIESEREFYDNLEFIDEFYADHLRTLARRQRHPRYTPRRIALAVIVVVMWIVFLLAVSQITGF